MADVRRLVELGMVPELAKEVAAQIDAAAAVAAVDAANFDFAGGTLQDFADAIGGAIPAAACCASAREQQTMPALAARSEDRCVGKEWVRTCRFRLSTFH